VREGREEEERREVLEVRGRERRVVRRENMLGLLLV
jgi:hypothetical protein